MSSGPTLGSPTPPRQALEKGAERLSEWFQRQPGTGPSMLLVAAADDLPDVELSMERDRRLFARTMQLLVEAHQTGQGPPVDAALVMRTRRMRRRFNLEWRSAPPEGDGSRDQFARGALSDGVRTMTNVGGLVVSWSTADRSWHLRLVTLAGALVGTSPSAAVAVPLEPEDVEGLLGVLRAFRKGANPSAV